MQVFYGHTTEYGPVCDWNAIQGEAGNYERFVIEIRPDDEGLRQYAWLHCDEGPFAIFAKDQGCSVHEAELLLKRECGEQWFVIDITEANWHQLGDRLRGKLYYECLSPVCHRLIQPNKVAKIKGQKCCPHCGKAVKLIFIKSKTMLTKKQRSSWIENIIDFMDLMGCRVMPPDPEWRKNRQEEIQAVE